MIAAPLLTLVTLITLPQSPPVPTSLQKSAIQIAVVGTPHLSGHDFTKAPIDTAAVRGRLAAFKPDMVAVEWLHPSIRPEDTLNYSSLGDLDTLTRLWGYGGRDIEALRKETLQSLLELKAKRLPTVSHRVELGKLHYLSKDPLNAGYQWWQASRLGADVRDLRRLTLNNYERHELEIYGFPIAQAQGLEDLTPFDYQGRDAEWQPVMRRLWERTRAALIKRRHGLEETTGGEAWKAKASEYDKGYDNDHAAWLKEYGRFPEAQQYERLREGSKLYAEADQKLAGTTDGLAIMRYVQSDAHRALERKIYYDIITSIQIDGLGPLIVANYERRNARMADFVEHDIAAKKATRVLIIVGSGHRMFLEDEFRKRGYKLVFASGLLGSPSAK